MKVVFIILNWNNSDLTIQAVENIEKTEQGNFGIIVIDNHSNITERQKLIRFAVERSWKIISENRLSSSRVFKNLGEFLRILLLTNKNYGYAKGNNLGLKFAKEVGYDWAVIMNNDIILEKPILKDLLRLASKDDMIAIIGPKIIGIDGKRQGPISKPGVYSYFISPLLFPITYPVEKLILKFKEKSLYKNEVTFPYAILGCFMLTNLKALEEIGWFDENTFLYAEEMILSEKLKKNGYKIAYTEKVYVKHLGGASTILLGDNKRKNIGLQSYLYYFQKYRNYGPIKLSLIKFGLMYKMFVLLPIKCKFISFIKQSSEKAKILKDILQNFVKG
jgi:GT2 family glycosyltransferase